MILTYKQFEGPYAEKIDSYFGAKNCLIEINPGKVLLPPQFKEIGQKIIEAPVRKNDTWLLSCPRTGSTWTQEMVWLIGNNFDYDGAKKTIQQIRAPHLELSALLVNEFGSFMDKYGNSVDVVNNLPSPRYIKSHLPWELLPKQLEEVKPKIIYVARNPKDMCVSCYHYFQLVHDMKATFEEFADLFLNEKIPTGPIWSHILKFWNKRNEENVLFVKYEDIKKDLRNTILKVAKFLEKPITEEQTETLMGHLSFQNMKNNPAVNLKPIMEMKNGKDYFEKCGKTFIRKGKVGDWKNHMNTELSKRFDDWIIKNTEGTGLEFESLESS